MRLCEKVTFFGEVEIVLTFAISRYAVTCGTIRHQVTSGTHLIPFDFLTRAARDEE